MSFAVKQEKWVGNIIYWCPIAFNSISEERKRPLKPVWTKQGIIYKINQNISPIIFHHFDLFYPQLKILPINEQICSIYFKIFDSNYTFKDSFAFAEEIVKKIFWIFYGKPRCWISVYQHRTWRDKISCYKRILFDF